MAKKLKPMFTDSDWSFPMLERVYKECEIIAKEELGLDTYPNQIEIISSDQMLDQYASVGMPVMYSHWSFGKQREIEGGHYSTGKSGLAYEIVVNTNPTVNYLMEENTMTMQALVIAHAAFGHNSFFKNNYLFRQWTDAEGIVDYLDFAKKYIAECEEKYGHERVETLLDAAHALRNHGVDKYRRPGKLTDEKQKQKDRESQALRDKEVNILWDTLPNTQKDDSAPSANVFPAQPEENILYFIEKHSPVLETWQREIIRIVRKIAQYLYPQRQTQVMNEGWATFCHYYIMTRLHEKGLLTDGQYMEFMHSHTSVVAQPAFDSSYYSGFNPYWLGFNMFMDMKRICETPTDEDREWFPDIAGKPWLPVLKDAMENYRDESFIRQFLSPKLIRDKHLFLVDDYEGESVYFVDKIHNENGYKSIRTALANSYQIANYVPDIQVVRTNLLGDRVLHIQHTMTDNMSLKDPTKVIGHLQYLWGNRVVLKTVDSDGDEYVYEEEFVDEDPDF